MPYIPGDNWAICDLSGKKVLMSKTSKTWDGLRVWSPLWYPKHPQLEVRGLPETSMVVKDARPRQSDRDGNPTYGFGSFTLTSPNGTNYIVYVTNAGALATAAGTFGLANKTLYIGQYGITVDNSGNLSATDSGSVQALDSWTIYSQDLTEYTITIVTGTITVTEA